MIIFPAIDIKDGTCVRLVKGDYATAHKVAENAVETAKSFQNAGASWIHMVDLDGAKDAKPVNSSLVFDVLANTDLKVEIGGGIRNMETIAFYLEQGVSRVILGSVALRNPQLVKEAVAEYGDKIAVGIRCFARQSSGRRLDRTIGSGLYYFGQRDGSGRGKDHYLY